VSDPDTTSTISVVLYNSTEQLGPVTQANADQFVTLIMVGLAANAEVMSYGSSVLVSPGQYNLTNLHRGLYGTPNQAHAAGASFIRLDGSIFQLVFDPGMAGQQIFFKFLSYNTYGRGLQSLADVQPYSYTIPAGAVGGALGTNLNWTPRGNAILSVNGKTLYKPVSGSLATTAFDGDAVTAAAHPSLVVSFRFGGGANLNQVNPFLQGSTGGTVGLGLVGAVAQITNSGINPLGAGGGSPYPTTNAFWFAIAGGVQPPHAVTDPLNSQVSIMENGSLAQNFRSGQYGAPGDLFEIVYDGFIVQYLINGTLVRQTNAPALQLYGAVSLLSPGVMVAELQGYPGVPPTASINVYTSTSSTGTFNGTLAAPITLLSVSVPAQNQASTVVVTFYANLNITSSGSTGYAWGYIASAVNGSYNNANNNALIQSASGVTQAAGVTVEATFALAANTAVTYNMYAFRGGGSTGAGYNVGVLKAEVLMR
jgi:hypothetical protein